MGSIPGVSEETQETQGQGHVSPVELATLSQAAVRPDLIHGVQVELSKSQKKSIKSIRLGLNRDHADCEHAFPSREFALALQQVVSAERFSGDPAVPFRLITSF